MTPEVEQRLRAYLWLSHGHAGGYGDDGEMQCGACLPVWDYKRAPLADVISAAISARMAVNLAALTSQRPDTPSVIAEIPTVASPPEPTDAVATSERLLLNEYGRRCYRAGQDSTSASLTALREAAQTMVARWRGEYELALEHDRKHGLRDTTVELGGKATAADELSTALAAPRLRENL